MRSTEELTRLCNQILAETDKIGPGPRTLIYDTAIGAIRVLGVTDIQAFGILAAMAASYAIKADISDVEAGVFMTTSHRQLEAILKAAR